jgi:hypothetical protein
MNLWECRGESTAALQTTSAHLAVLLNGAFSRVDEAVEYFQKFLMAEPSAAGRVCAVTAIKGRNLALGCYSLALDGLAQESGALLRPLLEAIELLEYLRVVPGAVDRALDGRLPNAGKRAREIGSSFQSLREHLNLSASHLGFGGASVRHLLDISAGRFRVAQQFSEAVLEQNLATIFVFTAILAREAAVCFQWCGSSVAPTSAESLLNKACSCVESGEPIVKPIFAKRPAVERGELSS